MTAAGVQNIDSTAYVPPSPSASTPDTKGTGLAGKPAADPQAAGTASEPADFRNELEQQQTGANETKPGSLKTVQEKTGQKKSGSSKTGKKQTTEPDRANVSVATPVQVADPQKPILPFTLTLAQPQENAQPDTNANVTASVDDYARSAENPAETVLERAQAAISLAAGTAAADIKPTATAKQSPKLVQSVARVSTADVAPSAKPDLSQPAQLASGLPLPAQLPWPAAAAPKSDQVSSRQQDQNQAATSSKTSEQSQPVSPIELHLPAAPPEPIATAVQETVESTPSSPSALAFAARMAPAAGKTNPVVASNAAQILPVPGPQTPAQIPVRYAAMAQIIQSAVAGNKNDGLKKDPGAAFDPLLRENARSDIRIDLVAPQAPTAEQPSQPSASSSTPEAPPPPAPTAQLEHVIEPPAAPPTSNHDIRVRVPDNNGGSTQVRFVESGGEVRVSVRTSDDGLAQNLRTHLNDLTQRLSDGGMPAEIWKPASNGASSQNDQHPSNQDGRGAGGQGSGGQSGQQDRQQKRPAWLEEMEASLHPEHQ
ncbi:MAG TPA: hypothetical protein VGQ49_22550 [Bryobacteraceae bacterium]|jgi:hypothetical protein|nr:hypothetical protein [Bryobacteraceae bacterium]